MAILIHGDTLRSPALRHEIPLAIGDPFLYLETDAQTASGSDPGGRRAVVTNALEVDRIAAAAPEVERLLFEELGADELIAAGHSRPEVELEVSLRAVQRLGIREASVPPEFPLALADRLRAEGVQVRAEDELFAERRRHKTAAELEGIRRATAAGLAGLDEAARILRAAQVDGDGLRLDGEVLTAEALRARIREVCARLGAPAPEDVIVAPMRPDDDIGHEPGSGPLPANAPLCVDLWPQDEATGCWSDMTRTWVAGEISEPVAALHALVLEAHERALAAVRPGVRGVDVYGAACDVFEAAGHPTQRTKAPGETLRHGFFFGLGHGVGLEVHEPPALGRTGREPLVAGDVVAVEPGTVDLDHGGMRVEDLVLVTEDGFENLTASRTYDLRP
jgi:Xaa-Pro aminopeptidase